MPNISRSKGDQTMNISQLIDCNVRNTFRQKSCRKWVRETSSRPLFVFKKAIYEEKVSGQHLNFNIFWQSSTCNKNKLNKILDCWSRDAYTRKQIILIHLLVNISRSKSNQTMNFGQLIEHNMRNIFLEKSCPKCSWKN